MKKLLLIAIVLFGMGPLLKAQMLNLNYQISVPLGDLKDFTNETSFRGMDLEYHKFVTDRFSLGAAIGWNVFYQDKNHATGDFSFKGNKNIYTMTGNQYRYVNTVPLTAIGRYFLTDGTSAVQPFLGLGSGARWTEKRLELGQYTSTLSRWQFTFAPEIGMMVPFNDQVALNVGARYNYATRASHGRIPEFQSFTFSIGLILMSGNNTAE